MQPLTAMNDIEGEQALVWPHAQRLLMAEMHRVASQEGGVLYISAPVECAVGWLHARVRPRWCVRCVSE